MPQDSELAEVFRRAELRLRRLLLGDGVTEPGVVKGEEARTQVTATLRQLREAFTQALGDGGGEGTGPDPRGGSQLPEELRRRAVSVIERDLHSTEADTLLTPAEAADALGLSVSSVYRAIRSGRIAATRAHDGTLRVPASELGRARGRAVGR